MLTWKTYRKYWILICRVLLIFVSRWKTLCIVPINILHFMLFLSYIGYHFKVFNGFGLPWWSYLLLSLLILWSANLGIICDGSSHIMNLQLNNRMVEMLVVSWANLSIPQTPFCIFALEVSSKRSQKFLNRRRTINNVRQKIFFGHRWAPTKISMVWK